MDQNSTERRWKYHQTSVRLEPARPCGPAKKTKTNKTTGPYHLNPKSFFVFTAFGCFSLSISVSQIIKSCVQAFSSLYFPQQCICLVMIARMSASHKGQCIEVTCTGTPSDAVSSVVHRVGKTWKNVEQRDYTKQERKNIAGITGYLETRNNGFVRFPWQNKTGHVTKTVDILKEPTESNNESSLERSLSLSTSKWLLRSSTTLQKHQIWSFVF